MLERLPELARSRLDPAVYGYFAEGAGDETVLRANVAAFDRYKLRPRVLVDLTSVSTSTTILGEGVSVPILIAPLAHQRLLDPGGEAATASAASDAGAGFCLSTFSSTPLEEVAARRGAAPQWFQLYPLRWEIVESLVTRAAAAGFSAVVVTVDAAARPPRPREVVSGFDPFVHSPPALFEDAGFRACLDERGEGLDAVALVHALFPNPRLTWADLRRICDMTDLPVVVKGVVRGDDARRACDAGAAGVVVSNHGGRQCDDVRPAIDCLEEVAQATGDDIEVFFDSGIRRGAHVLKAMALGARAVLLGRPVLWALAVGGRQGVARVLDVLSNELRTTMRQAGVASVGEVSRDLVT